MSNKSEICYIADTFMQFMMLLDKSGCLCVPLDHSPAIKHTYMHVPSAWHGEHEDSVVGGVAVLRRRLTPSCVNLQVRPFDDAGNTVIPLPCKRAGFPKSTDR